MTNKEKFLALVSKEKTNTLEKNKARIKNRAMLRESQQIALKVLNRLDDLGWSQKQLAAKMEVSPQQVNKIVKGQENLTLTTIVKLQEVLNILILVTSYEHQISDLKTELDIVIQRKLPELISMREIMEAEYQPFFHIERKVVSQPKIAVMQHDEITGEFQTYKIA